LADRPEHYLNDFFFWPPPLHLASLGGHRLLSSPSITPPPVHDDLHVLTSLGRLGQQVREIGARPRDNDAYLLGPAGRILPASEGADEK